MKQLGRQRTAAVTLFTGPLQDKLPMRKLNVGLCANVKSVYARRKLSELLEKRQSERTISALVHVDKTPPPPPTP